MATKAADPEIRRFRERLETSNKNGIPIWQKESLSIDEAVAYTGIGRNSLYKLYKRLGKKIAFCDGYGIFIKRKSFERYINSVNRIAD